MPTELIKRVDWSLIYPPFMERCFELAALCRERGADYYAISGTRTFPEQTALWRQGRFTPGKIVTNALAGQSAHNYGIAVDWCSDADETKAGLQPEWNLPAYETLAVAATDLGLESAYYWKKFREGPHVQLPIAAHGLKLSYLKAAHDAGGMRQVWGLLDSRGPWFPEKK